MRNLILGLILGILAGVISYFFIMPPTKEKAYASGYDKGSSEGYYKGFEEGKITQASYNDSVAEVKSARIEAERKVESNVPVKKKPDYNINYSMNGNEVGERK